MEATENPLGLVHVLRHSFRSSEQLKGVLESFYPPEAENNHSTIEIRSLGMLALDAYRHANYEFSIPLIEARKDVERSRGNALEITHDVGIRRIGEKTIDVLMGIQDKTALHQLHYDMRKRLPEGKLMHSNVDRRFSVFARINANVPISDDFEADAMNGYYEKYEQLGEKHLLSVVPTGISGMDQWLPLPSTYLR